LYAGGKIPIAQSLVDRYDLRIHIPWQKRFDILNTCSLGQRLNYATMSKANAQFKRR